MWESIRHGLGHVATGSDPRDRSQLPSAAGASFRSRNCGGAGFEPCLRGRPPLPCPDRQARPVSAHAAVPRAPDGGTPKASRTRIPRDRVTSLLPRPGLLGETANGAAQGRRLGPNEPLERQRMKFTVRTKLQQLPRGRLMSSRCCNKCPQGNTCPRGRSEASCGGGCRGGIGGADKARPDPGASTQTRSDSLQGFPVPAERLDAHAAPSRAPAFVHLSQPPRVPRPTSFSARMPPRDPVQRGDLTRLFPNRKVA